MGPNELTRHYLSAAPNGAFSRPAKRHHDGKVTGHYGRTEIKQSCGKGTKNLESRETDKVGNNECRVPSLCEKRGPKKIDTPRTEQSADVGTQINRNVTHDSVPKRGSQIGHKNPHNVANGRVSTDGDLEELRPEYKKTEGTESMSLIKPADSDPIRSHLLDTNRFYRSHLWRELPPGDRSFKPVTTRPRPRDMDNTNWQHDPPRLIDNNRTDRAFRPVTPRRLRYHDPTSFSQSPTRCTPLLASPESILQTQIKALQSQSLHENVINKDQPTGELLRGLGKFSAFSFHRSVTHLSIFSLWFWNLRG